MEISNNKTSLLISSQLPEFIRSDHQTFLTFMEEYYKFMEQESGVLNVSKNFLRQKDVDIADGIFLEKLYDNFIKLLPKNILADKRLVLKHVKDFYRARGSEKSVRFLLRILLNKEAEFYYPKRDVMTLSDGKWFIEKSIRIDNIRVNNTSNTIARNNFKNKYIYGANSNATAIVENLDVYYDRGELIHELKLSNQYKDFIVGEDIWCRFTEEGEDKYLSANLSNTITYPGRFLNDDGFMSAYNFFQDRDYYQKFSYVVRITEPLAKYKHPLKTLTHPAGTKLFGHFLHKDQLEGNTTVNVNTVLTNSAMLLSTYYVHIDDIIKSGSYNVKSLSATYEPQIVAGTYAVKNSHSATYNSFGSAITVTYPNHGFRTGHNVHLRFVTTSANVVNGLYKIVTFTQNTFGIFTVNANTTLIQSPETTSNLTFSSGTGTTNSWLTLSQYAANSNIAIAMSDSINIQGNLVTVVYISNNIIAVHPAPVGNIASNNFSVLKKPYYAYGNVTVYDPVITIKANATGLVTNNTPYLKFMNNDTTLSNTSYTVLSGNATQIKVTHKDIINAASFSGNVNVHLNNTVFTITNHGIAEGEQIFISSYTGDTANAANGLYNVYGVTENTFNVFMQNSVVTGGAAHAKISNVSLTVLNHGFSSNANVYVWFRTGDTANLTNGFHTITVKDANNFYVDISVVPTSNGSVSVYRNYANVTINRTSHGFSVGNTVRAMFETGNLSSIANGLFTVSQIANSNSYNVVHNSLSISSNLNNLLANNSGSVYVSLL